jgi:hypothetical protein
MALQPYIPLPNALLPRQVPMLRDPCRHPPAGSRELLPCRTPLDARHALPIWSPSDRKASPSHRQRGTTTLHPDSAPGLPWKTLFKRQMTLSVFLLTELH